MVLYPASKIKFADKLCLSFKWEDLEFDMEMVHTKIVCLTSRGQTVYRYVSVASGVILVTGNVRNVVSWLEVVF